MEYKIILVGQDNAKKTTIVYSFVADRWDSQVNTDVPSCVSIQLNVDKKIVIFNIWDTSGSLRFIPCGQACFKNSHLAIIVYSISDRSSFENVDIYNELVKRDAGPNTIIFLVANECEENPKAEITDEEGLEKAKSIGIHFFKVNCITGKGIEELFESMARECLKSFH